MKHRFALITLLAVALLAGATAAHVQEKGGPLSAAGKVTITLVRWPYT